MKAIESVLNIVYLHRYSLIIFFGGKERGLKWYLISV
jgi:hypothetical protein